MKKTLFILMMIASFMAACTPTEELVKTAIAQTETAAPSATASELPAQYQMQTALPLTLVPAAATLLSQQKISLQTAFVQTMTANVPSETPTSETITPSITSTHKPWPTITNTAIPYMASGPMSIDSIEDAGDNKVRINWNAQGSFLNGFYVIWSPTNASPSYPGDYWFYFANGRARSVEVNVKQAGTIYYRVCEVANDGKNCANYSNAVQFTNH